MANSAPPVTVTLATGSLPTFTGGTIASGTYYLTSAQLYGADAGNNNIGSTRQETVVVNGTSGQVVNDIGGTCFRATLSLAYSSNMFTATESCGMLFGPGTTMETLSFTATASGYSVAFSQSGGTTEVDTFTKQ